MTENKKSAPKKTVAKKPVAKNAAAKKKAPAKKKPAAKVAVNDSASSLHNALGDSVNPSVGALGASSNVGSYSTNSWIKNFFKKLLG